MHVHSHARAQLHVCTVVARFNACKNQHRKMPRMRRLLPTPASRSRPPSARSSHAPGTLAESQWPSPVLQAERYSYIAHCVSVYSYNTRICWSLRVCTSAQLQLIVHMHNTFHYTHTHNLSQISSILTAASANYSAAIDERFDLIGLTHCNDALYACGCTYVRRRRYRARHVPGAAAAGRERRSSRSCSPRSCWSAFHRN